MAINLTGVLANINDIKRDLFFDDGATLKFYRVNDLLLELSTGWYVPKNPEKNLAIGEEYFVCSVVDEEDELDLEPVIKTSTKVLAGQEEYKISAYFRPRGLTKAWKIRLVSMGKKSNT
ncbi:MAG TPA: hypothetical protein PLP33_27870 [Leptospiraceae bacterium]|nr:hypothetical protein [Leptospiraceae bacterium]